MYLARGLGAVCRTVPRLNEWPSTSASRINVAVRALSGSAKSANQDADSRATRLKPIYQSDMKNFLHAGQCMQVISAPALAFISYSYFWNSFSDEVQDVFGFDFTMSSMYWAFPYFATVSSVLALVLYRTPISISYKPASNTYVATMASACIPFVTWGYEFAPGLGVETPSSLPWLTGTCLIDGKKRVYLTKSDFTSSMHYHNIFKN